ncbi:Sec-independent protein translocase subunit TatA [Nocardia goodfellowii]
MGQFSIWHWVIVAAVFVLFFGAKRMPDAARGLGRSLRIFKSEINELHEDDNTAESAAPQPLPSARPQAQITPAPARLKSL